MKENLLLQRFCNECGKAFIPKRKQAKQFCSPHCTTLNWKKTHTKEILAFDLIQKQFDRKSRSHSVKSLNKIIDVLVKKSWDIDYGTPENKLLYLVGIIPNFEEILESLKELVVYWGNQCSTSEFDYWAEKYSKDQIKHS